VRWQIVTLYWYWDEPAYSYWDADAALLASAGAPKTPSGTKNAAVTAATVQALAFERAKKSRFTAASKRCLTSL